MFQSASSRSAALPIEAVMDLSAVPRELLPRVQAQAPSDANTYGGSLSSEAAGDTERRDDPLGPSFGSLVGSNGTADGIGTGANGGSALSGTGGARRQRERRGVGRPSKNRRSNGAASTAASATASSNAGTAGGGNDSDSSSSDELYCLCQKNDLAGDFMVACDVCNNWYHPKCVMLTRKSAELFDYYFCPRCLPLLSYEDLLMVEPSSYQAHVVVNPLTRTVRKREPFDFDGMTAETAIAFREAALEGKLDKNAHWPPPEFMYAYRMAHTGGVYARPGYFVQAQQPPSASAMRNFAPTFLTSAVPLAPAPDMMNAFVAAQAAAAAAMAAVTGPPGPPVGTAPSHTHHKRGRKSFKEGKEGKKSGKKEKHHHSRKKEKRKRDRSREIEVRPKVATRRGPGRPPKSANLVQPVPSTDPATSEPLADGAGTELSAGFAKPQPLVIPAAVLADSHAAGRLTDRLSPTRAVPLSEGITVVVREESEDVGTVNIDELSQPSGAEGVDVAHSNHLAGPSRVSSSGLSRVSSVNIDELSQPSGAEGFSDAVLSRFSPERGRT